MRLALRRGAAVTLLAMAMMPPAWAQDRADPAPVARFDFTQVYARALEVDPTWLAAQDRQRADAQERRIARAGLRPSAAYSYNRARNWSDIQEQFLGGTINQNLNYTSYTSSFILSQPLFDAAARARYREGVARSQAADFTLARARQALAVRVLQAYTDLLYANDQRALAKAQLEILDADAARVERSVKLGEGTRTDRTEVDAQHHLTEAQLIEAEDHRQDALNGVRAVAGPDIPDAAPAALISGCVPFEGRLQPLADWRAKALADNPELEAQRRLVDVARRQIDQERAAGLPSVAIFARQQVSDSAAENQIGQHYNTQTVGVQLRMPLYSGGGVLASTRQARDAYGEARHKLDATTNDLLNDLDRQYRTTESSRWRVEAYEKAVTSAEARIDATRHSMRGGERTHVDLLDAERQKVEAVQNLARARYDYLLAWLSLRWQAGTLEDADIARVGACFGGSPAIPTRQ